MVELRVQEVARARGITTITALAESAQLAYDTARDLWHGRMQRIDRDVLGRVCEALNCKVGDLIVYSSVPAINRAPGLSSVPA